MRSPNGRLGGFVLAVALWPGSAGAQTAAHSFEEIQRLLKVGQTVVALLCIRFQAEFRLLPGARPLVRL